jgi:hypothetical protein
MNLFIPLRLLHQLITISDEENMFACGLCQYKAGTEVMLKIHHTNLHQDMKYTTCGHQTLSKGGLRRHQEVIHEGKRYPCGECDYEATSKDHLTEHQQAIHIGKKYPCDHQATSKGNLTQHKRAIHEGKKNPCSECDYQSTTKGSLTQHHKVKHEGKKYPCMSSV